MGSLSLTHTQRYTYYIYFLQLFTNQIKDSVRTAAVVWWVELLPDMPGFNYLLMHLKSCRKWPLHHEGTWLQSHSDRTLIGIWRVTQQMENIAFCFSLSFLSNKSKLFFK